MGRYTGPKGRVNRRLGAMVYESNGAIKALERRDYPPGMHTRRNKPTNFGLGLIEKQKIKHHYGIREAQLRRYFDMAGRMTGNTGEQLLLLCERRLDNVVRRLGFAKTRPQGRQGITHGHFTVNGRKVTKPSFLVRPGDVIEIRKRANLEKVYRDTVDSQNIEPLSFAAFDADGLKAVVTGFPTAADISLPVEIGLVIEFMSR